MGKPTATGVWIHGSSGRMGQEIQALLVDMPKIFRLVGGSSKKFEGELFHQGKTVTTELLGQSLAKDGVDLILDFSTIEANELLLDAIIQGDIKNKSLIIGTTGLPPETIVRWKSVTEANQLSTLLAPNTSVGVLLTLQCALRAAGVLADQGFDIEITEAHHRHKVDAPSGTAKFLATSITEKVKGLTLNLDRQGKRIDGEVGVHSIRGGSVFGEHEIRFMGEHEELSISHRALSRTLFARGAITLGSWLIKQDHQFYTLNQVTI